MMSVLWIKKVVDAIQVAEYTKSPFIKHTKTPESTTDEQLTNNCYNFCVTFVHK